MFDIFVHSKSMTTIQYQILRYLPDRVSGEFVNLGVVAYNPSVRSLESEFINKSERILCFFPGNDGAYLIRLVKMIKKNLDEISFMLQAKTTFGDYPSIETITRTVLPKDDSSLTFGEVKSILDVSARTTVSDLFSRFANSYQN